MLHYILFLSLSTALCLHDAQRSAAWRSGGFHCCWDEPHTCKIKQNFAREKPAIAPNCLLCDGIGQDSENLKKHFEYFSKLSKYTKSKSTIFFTSCQSSLNFHCIMLFSGVSLYLGWWAGSA